MQELLVGEVVRRKRIEMGLTQEELCEGICEAFTISESKMANNHRHVLQQMHFCKDLAYQTADTTLLFRVIFMKTVQKILKENIKSLYYKNKLHVSVI